MRGAWLAALILTAVLAGCSGGEPPEDPDALSGDTVEVAPGIVVAVELGAVRGQVRNDASLPVAEARVQLTGTEFFMETGGKGGFRFVNVTPGQHTLRVEREGFLVLEEPINVTRGALVERTVHLLPDGSRGPGYRPHVHNMWRGQTEHTLLESTFDYRESQSDSDLGNPHVDPVYRTVLHPNRNESTSLAYIPIPEETDDGRANLVYPGAARVEVTLDWEVTSSTLSELGIAVHKNAGDLEYLGQKGPGETWTIPVGPNEADVGHQTFSFWEFYLYPGNNVLQPTEWEPGIIAGPIDITIKAFKGDTVPVEPEHPDFWGERKKLVLMDGSEVAYTDNSVAIVDRYRNQGHILMGETLIPPGTARMLVNHTWEYHDLDQELAGTAADLPWVLTWRTADQHPWNTELAEYRRVDGVSCGHHCVSYDFEVDGAWPDAFYQTRSLWAFLPSVEGYEEERDYRPDTRRGKDHYLEIIVWRE